jgi:hypothetical protein
MRGVATVPRLVRTMVMEWSPESDEPWPSSSPAGSPDDEVKATIEELALAVGRAGEARAARAEAAEELIFEPSF